MSKYRLTYFNAKGRAETIRLVFAATGMPYEDRRIDGAEWSKLKPYTPWNTLPLLEVEGNVIGQSVTIARYVAKEGGIGGRTNYEQALIDSVVDKVTEMREKVIKLQFCPNLDEKNAAIKDFEEQFLPAALPSLEKFLSRNPYNSGYFVGQTISLADVHFFSTIELLVPNMPDVLRRHNGLQELYEKVANHPGILEYLRCRPNTSF